MGKNYTLIYLYIFMNSNFKILFNQTSKDNFGNWNLNGEAQNI
jgi:hypothetical protein